MMNLEIAMKVCKGIDLVPFPHPDALDAVCFGQHEIVPQGIKVPSIKGDIEVPGWVVNSIEFLMDGQSDVVDVVEIGEFRNFGDALSLAFSREAKIYCDRIVGLSPFQKNFPPRLQELLIQNGFRVFAFRDLPESGQMAIAHYMCVDGAAWAVRHPDFEDWMWGEGTPYEPEMRLSMLSDLKAFMPRFIEAFGDDQFGYAEVSTQLLADVIELCHPDYSVSDVPNKKRGAYDVPTWASILVDDDEILQDGWTRFYDRLVMGIETTPLVWYC